MTRKQKLLDLYTKIDNLEISLKEMEKKRLVLQDIKRRTGVELRGINPRTRIARPWEPLPAAEIQIVKAVLEEWYPRPSIAFGRWSLPWRLRWEV